MADIDDGRSRQEVDSLYGQKITTDKGYADIVYRNSSNEYYGGDCNYEPNFKRSDNLTEISKDWFA